MEESEEILLNSLQNGGVSVPEDVSSIKGLTPPTLFLICVQSLNLIDETASFPTSLPDSMAEKFKICTDMSSAIKNLGYIGDISYYKLLYPSEEDLYKLIRFLVERLSEQPKGVKVVEEDIDATRKTNRVDCGNTLGGNDRENLDNGRVKAQLEELKLNDELPGSSKTEGVSVDKLFNGQSILHSTDDVALDVALSSKKGDFSVNEQTSVISGEDLTEESGNLRGTGNGETTVRREDVQVSTFEQKMQAEILQSKEEADGKEVTSNSSELKTLEEEFELLKQAAEMAFDNTLSTEYQLEQLNEQVEAKKNRLAELQLHWDNLRNSLEEKRRNLEVSLYANQPEAKQKLKKLREVELERQAILSELQKREVELSKLSTDLNNQPKGAASRKSYIDRVKEITKNSRKQDADIERILKETRELQLESNSIRECLDRTYAVVDDMIFREAKKDPVGRQAYKILTSIHESFEQVAEKILATDRVRREAADYEKKLAAMASRSVNVDKLQADLDVIMRENEYLENHHRND